MGGGKRMLEIIVPEDTVKLDRQIKALEWQIKHDTSEKDRCIHMAAYERLIEERKNRKEPFAEGSETIIHYPHSTAELGKNQDL